MHCLPGTACSNGGAGASERVGNTHMVKREKVVLKRATLSSCSYRLTQSSSFFWVGLSAGLVSQKGPFLKVSPRCTDQWRWSLLHADCMSVPSVCGSWSARRGTRSNARSSSSRSHASGLTRPFDPPHRRSCTTLQYVHSGLSDLRHRCGSSSCCRTLRMSSSIASDIRSTATLLQSCHKSVSVPSRLNNRSAQRTLLHPV